MSRLEAAYEAAETQRTGPRCSVGILLDKVDQEDRKALVAALADLTRNRAVLAEAIRTVHGVDISQGTLARHMRRHCRCRE